MTWQQFVLAHGRYGRDVELAAIVDQPVAAIRQLRAQASCAPGPRRPYAELFAMWRGRPPGEDDWPAPWRGGSGRYVWLGPEIALLARLVGTMSTAEISRLLTARLRKITGDPAASRSRATVQIRIGLIGMQASELIGGFTVPAAARQVGSVAVVHHAIKIGQLRTFRIGRRHVIRRDLFEAWLAARDRPPEGYVPLASLREPLGISSDSKLPEYAALGAIPDVHLVQSSHRWFIKAETAAQILSDARAQRPLPWHGAPLMENLWASWLRWQERKHKRCPTCRAIWGGAAPRSLEDFAARYPALELGQKKHLTKWQHRRPPRPFRPWGSSRTFRSRGITVAAAARELGTTVAWVRAQIRRGVVPVLRDPLGGEAQRLTRVSLGRLRRLVDRPAPVDADAWLGVYAAAAHAGVTTGTVMKWAAQGHLVRRQGRRGVLYARASLERQAVAYWRQVRFKRATPPAWIQERAA